MGVMTELVLMLRRVQVQVPMLWLMNVVSFFL